MASSGHQRSVRGSKKSASHPFGERALFWRWWMLVFAQCAECSVAALAVRVGHILVCSIVMPHDSAMVVRNKLIEHSAANMAPWRSAN